MNTAEEGTKGQQEDEVEFIGIFMVRNVESRNVCSIGGERRRFSQYVTESIKEGEGPECDNRRKEE